MTILSEDQIAEMEARAEMAAPGPWVQRDPLLPHEVLVKRSGNLVASTLRVYDGDGNVSTPNADFIAAARTDVPALVASHRLLAEEVARLHERLEDNHVFVSGPDGDLVRQEVEPGTIPDGIDCRDTTIHELDKVVAELRAERDALSLQVARLTEALKPFAAMADHYDRHYGNRPREPHHTVMQVATHDVGEHEITVGDFRNARSALSKHREAAHG